MKSEVLPAGYAFSGGFPTQETVQKAYDDADLARAVQAYRFFYPSVSMMGVWNGNLDMGIVPNRIFGILEGNPKQRVFTPNSDTPYAGLLLDLREGPLVVEFPPGPLMSVVNDRNQRFGMDMGVPGPDGGRGGRHLLLPPGSSGAAPAGYYVGKPNTFRVLLMLRAMPVEGDLTTAIALMKTVRVYPLDASRDWEAPTWLNLTQREADLTPLKWEHHLAYWEVLHSLIDSEPPVEEYHDFYGELATLGISKGRPFAPDARMRGILEKAAELGNAQMRVQAFADRRPERLPWADRKWEWATLRPENGDFNTPSYKDLDAREKWFFQAQIESPAMFSRTPGHGSLYWLGLRDKAGSYLDGAKSYKLTVSLPVPADLFWSVTVYDPGTRSEIQTDQNKAALRSLFELKDLEGAKTVDLYFGPQAPAGKEGQWIQTLPDRGWFAYFRIYGPELAAFDQSWKLSDFEEVESSLSVPRA